MGQEGGGRMDGEGRREWGGGRGRGGGMGCGGRREGSLRGGGRSGETDLEYVDDDWNGACRHQMFVMHILGTRARQGTRRMRRGKINVPDWCRRVN